MNILKLFKRQEPEKRPENEDNVLIEVPKLRQYIVDGYDEIKKLKAEIVKLKEVNEKLNEKSVEHSALQVIVDEKDRRIDELKREYEDLKHELGSVRTSLNRSKDEVARLRINLENTNVEKVSNRAKAEQATRILIAVNSMKGNLSKAKVLEAIKGVSSE